MAVDRTNQTEFQAEIFVSLRPVVNDPEGLAIREGLQSLGYSEVQGVRSGKYLQVRLTANDADAAKKRVAEMCERLLSNTVIEQYRVAVQELTPTSEGR